METAGVAGAAVAVVLVGNLAAEGGPAESLAFVAQLQAPGPAKAQSLPRGPADC